jgi:iron complex outermembrane receptor protein
MMSKRATLATFTKTALCAAVAATLSIPGQVQAQQSGGTILEEVMVTARKRQESLRDVPFSINAQTEEQLRRSGATDIESMSRNVAGFSVQNLGPGQSQVAIRGISAGQIARDLPGVKEHVGVYLDESVISLSLFTPDLDFYDTHHVEVLRGPQGTLFGSGSLAGTVRYISNRPELDTKDASMDGTVMGGSDVSTGGDLKGMINIPIADNMALRLVGYTKQLSGFVDAVQPNGKTNEDVNDGTNNGFRAALRIEATDRLVITPRIVYQDIEVDGMNREDDYNILGNEFTTTRPPVKLGKHEQYTQLTEQFEDELKLFDLTVQWDITDSMELTPVTSYTERDILMLRDATQLTASITAQPDITDQPEEVYTIDGPLDDSTDVEMLTQEIRLASTGDGDLDWVAGVFYSDVERDYGQTLFVDGWEEATGIPNGGVIAGTDELFYSRIPYDLEQVALFGELNYHIGDKWTITAGLRWYSYDEERTLNFDGLFADQTLGLKGETDSDGFSPRVIVKYDMNDEVQLNAQVSKGVRLGGINDPLNAPLCSPEDLQTFGGFDTFDDEELTNYEIGAKVDFMDGAGNFNVALFYSEIEDLQATLEAGTCSSRIVYNVPDAYSQGVEFELFARPWENIEFGVAGTYIDSELDSTVTSTDADGNSSVLAGLKKGNMLPTAPEYQFSGTATWYFPVMDTGWEGYLTGTYQYVGERWTQFGDQAPGFGTVDVQVTPIGDPSIASFTYDPELDEYDILNIRLGATTDKWDVALWVNNVTDERAQLGLDRERGGRARGGFLTNPPRTIGLTGRYQF